jgi:hypothetical protein
LLSYFLWNFEKQEIVQTAYAKVIAVLTWNNLFAKNIKIKIFPNRWLREVHACQRILKLKVFIIFIYFFIKKLCRKKRIDMGEKIDVYPLVLVGNTNWD